jgi:Leucine-rich repeat (LRR) protein
MDKKRKLEQINELSDEIDKLKNKINNITSNWIKNNDNNIELKLNELNILSNVDFLFHFPNDVINLNCSGNNLQTFFILPTSKLVKLKIFDNKLTNLTINQSLTYLDISNNLINNIFNITNVNNLTFINLSNNLIGEVDFSYFPNIKDICLSNNKISDIKNLDSVKNLEYLDLSNNDIIKIDVNLPKLTVLKLGYNKLHKINLNTPNLNELYCNNNKLKKLPDLSNSLTFIDIKYNLIEFETINLEKGFNNYLIKAIPRQLTTQLINLDNTLYNPTEKNRNIKTLYIEALINTIKTSTSYTDYLTDIEVWDKNRKQSASDTVVMTGLLSHPNLTLFDVYNLNYKIFLKTYDMNNYNASIYNPNNSLDSETDIYIQIISNLIYGNNTPHLVNCIASNVYNDKRFIIMESIHGYNLFDFLMKYPLSFIEIICCLFQIFYTLKCFERVNLVHNDLHLGNILVEQTPIKYTYKIDTDINPFSIIELQCDFTIKIFDFDRASVYNPFVQRNFKLDINLCKLFNQCNMKNYKVDIYYILYGLYTLFYQNVRVVGLINQFFHTKVDLSDYFRNKHIAKDYNILKNADECLATIIKYLINENEPDTTGNTLKFQVDKTKTYIKIIKSNEFMFTLPQKHVISNYKPLLKPITIPTDYLFSSWKTELDNIGYLYLDKFTELKKLYLQTHTIQKDEYIYDHIFYMLIHPILYGIPNIFLIIFNNFEYRNDKLKFIRIYNDICLEYKILPIEIPNLYGNSVYDINLNVDINMLFQKVIHASKNPNIFEQIKKAQRTDFEKYLTKLNNVLLSTTFQFNQYIDYLYLSLVDTVEPDILKYMVYYFYFKYNTSIEIPESNKPHLQNLIIQLKNIDDEYIKFWIDDVDKHFNGSE